MYTLGLDIGMASVGAALLTNETILALHVRTFDKAEVPKTGDSLNKVRRDARSSRRRLRRRAHRLLRLARAMKREGLIALASPEAFAIPGTSPWELRAEGLDRLLESREWAAVLYHLCKHRGFQSTRKAQEAADAEATRMLGDIRENQRRLTESGCRTVGELAARHPDFAEAKRNKAGEYRKTFARADIEAELALLFSRQRDLGNPHAQQDFEKSVCALLMARRPALSSDALKKMVGRCTFESGEYRAPKACYSAERFVWLSTLNNLRILNRGASRPLTEQERDALKELPFLNVKLSYAQIRRKLALNDDEKFKGLVYGYGDKNPESRVAFEAKAFHAMRRAFESAGLTAEWGAIAQDRARLDQLAECLTYGKEDAELLGMLEAAEFSRSVSEAVLSCQFDAFINLSLKALERILSYMERGQRYDEAMASAGYEHSKRGGDTPRTTFLPPPDRALIRNPVVYRALNQARKLVNVIVRTYGPPKAIHIELARDLSRSYEERRRIQRDQDGFRRSKERDVEDFIRQFGCPPRRQDLRKWQLYREQSGKCLYSLKALDLGRLFEDGYVEIDHALPFSRSFDDSKNNQVLVLSGENRNKGNLTPFEYLGGADESSRWREFQAWVCASNLRPAKKDRLLRIHFGREVASEFRERNLNDTRYICREFKRLLEDHLQWHPDASGKERCVVLSGQLTALLRARWGLLKEREAGDLHHALDAAVIAAASQSLVKRMTDHAKYRETRLLREGYVDPETGEVLERLEVGEEKFPAPWPHFREELLGRLSRDPATKLKGVPGYDSELLATIQPVRVSRAPRRRQTGAVHQDTIRSVGKDQRWLRDGKSAVKTPLTALKLKDLPNIVGYDDPRNAALIEAIRCRLAANGDDGMKAFGPGREPLYKPSKPGKSAPAVKTVNLFSTQKSGLLVRGGVANNGSMIRVDIFKQGKRHFAIPIYASDMASGELPSKLAVANVPETDWPELDKSFAFMFSLHAGDWIRVVRGKDVKEGYFTGFNRSTASISFDVHDRNPEVAPKGSYESVGIKTVHLLEKFHVDLLGGLHKVRGESREVPPRRDHKVKRS